MSELKPEPVMIPKWRCPECGSIHTTEEGCIEHIAAQHAPTDPEAKRLIGKYIAYSDPTVRTILRADTARGSRVSGRAVLIQEDDYAEIQDYHWVDVGADALRILSGEDEACELWTLWVAELAERSMDRELRLFDAIKGVPE